MPLRNIEIINEHIQMMQQSEKTH